MTQAQVGAVEGEHPRDPIAVIEILEEEVGRLRALLTDCPYCNGGGCSRCDELGVVAPSPRALLERLAGELEERAQIHAEKRAEVKKAEADDRASGKLKASQSYEATWNYHEGLAVANERAAHRLREEAEGLGEENLAKQLHDLLNAPATQDRLRKLLQDRGWTYLTPESVRVLLALVLTATLPPESQEATNG